MNIETLIAIHYNQIYMKAPWFFQGLGWLQEVFCRHERQYRRRGGWYCIKCGKK